MAKRFTTEDTTPSGYNSPGKVYRRPDPKAPTPVKAAIKKRLKR